MPAVVRDGISLVILNGVIYFSFSNKTGLIWIATWRTTIFLKTHIPQIKALHTTDIQNLLNRNSFIKNETKTTTPILEGIYSSFLIA